MCSKDQWVAMECSLRFSMSNPDGNVTFSSEGKASLNEEWLTLSSKEGRTLTYSVRDLLRVDANDYRIALKVPEGALLLFNLGAKYEDMVRELHRSRGELVLKDMLMDEQVRKPSVSADLRMLNGGKETSAGRCEVRIYETALVIIPENLDPIRVLLSDLASVRKENFGLLVEEASGKAYELKRLGKEIDPLANAIIDGMAELKARVQEMLKEIMPAAAPSAIESASQLMREGHAGGRADLERSAPGLWSSLEKRLRASGIGAEYDHLASLSEEGGLRIGVKRGLKGEGPNDYLWVLAPILDVESRVRGNAIALEATTEDGEGRATYFFRIFAREQYRGLPAEELRRSSEELLDRISSCLVTINFRREPIYLEEAQLFAPDNLRYRYAIARLPDLRSLRERFVGRVMHLSPEQWQSDVLELLTFNGRERSDSARWAKKAEGRP